MKYIIDKNTEEKYDKIQKLLKEIGVIPVDSIKFILTKEVAVHEVVGVVCGSFIIMTAPLITNAKCFRDLYELFIDVSQDNMEVTFTCRYYG